MVVLFITGKQTGIARQSINQGIWVGQRHSDSAERGLESKKVLNSNKQK